MLPYSSRRGPRFGIGVWASMVIATTGCSLSLGLDTLDSQPGSSEGGTSGLAGQTGTGGNVTAGPGGMGGESAGTGGASTGGTSSGSGGMPGTAGFPNTAGAAGAGASAGAGAKGGAGGVAGKGAGGAGSGGTPAGNGGSSGANAGTSGANAGMAGTSATGGGGSGSAGAPMGVIDLASGQKTPLGIGLDDLHVYWVNTAPPAIYRVLKTGGTPEALVTSVDLSDPRDVVVDGTTIYWSEWTGNLVRKRDISGGTPQDFVTGAGRVSFLAMNSGILYATDDRTDQLGQGTVVVVPAGTTGAQVLFSAEPLSTGLSIAGNDLAWGRNGSIALGTTSGGPSVTLVGQPDTVKVGGVALDDVNVYWIEDSQRIRMANRASAKASTYYDPPGAFGNGDVVVDATFVYWTEPDSGFVRKQAK